VTAGIALPLSAGAASDLPTKTPEEVLQLVSKSHDLAGFSGTVEQVSNLGLPTLPATGTEADAASAISLLTGTHTARVFEAGAGERRVQVLDRMSERDVVRNGSDVWFWDAKKNVATHVAVPQRAADSADSSDVSSPADAARRALDAIDSSTQVAVDGGASVAGRDAYRLVLTPRSDGTTVGSVVIAVDGVTGLPLSVEVIARGATSPAFSVAFTEIDLTKPADSVFDFRPPTGATVKQQALPERHEASGTKPSGAKVTGSGWDAVVSVPAGGSAAAQVATDPLGGQLTKAVDGGRVLSTTLVNVLLTDDGRVLAGAVPVSRLQAVAAAG
jgi:outer membrane lipoprotein-sorting protein